jgi:hypothetical protein
MKCQLLGEHPASASSIMLSPSAFRHTAKKSKTQTLSYDASSSSTSPSSNVRNPDVQTVCDTYIDFAHQHLVYQVELPVLFGRLLRDESPAFDRNTPNLFEEELDDLLQEYGPQIWPEFGAGSRDHLRKPREGTRYTSDLVYPRDHAM